MNIEQAQSFYRRSVKPYLFMLEPEFAHGLSHFGFQIVDFLTDSSIVEAPALSDKFAQDFCGTKIQIPIGLAAGFDKNALLYEHLPKLGFGFVEVGSITNRPSRGNPKPRLFRLPQDQAIINFMGLNGDGAQVISTRLKSVNSEFPIAVNIAKTNDATIVGDKAIEDILSSFKAVSNLKVAYIALNVSCPNTHSDIQEVGRELADILVEVKKLNQRNTPLFLKISPDSDDRLLSEIFSASSNCDVSGFICGNTSVSRENLKTRKDILEHIGRGGLSGKPLKNMALNMVKKVNQLKSSSQKIIACGGISSGQDAFEFIVNGASLIEIYTALVYRGPFVAYEILNELEKILEENGLSLSEAIGSRIKTKI